ncbi:MAG: tRNA (adenosine(37)-N6)-threonylcarbamoyltransferase complex dimerization subunit type 1 TsaB [Actinomycetota bacterium]
MTHVLAFDTATDVVTVAVGRDGVPVATVEVDSARTHAEQLVPAVRRCATEAGVALDRLDAIAVGVGPGRFTGLRVGVTTAKVMADALGIPVIGLSTLEVLAAPWVAPDREVVSVIDARRREVYWARYRTGGPTGPVAAAPEAVAPPAEVAAVVAGLGPSAWVVGDGALRHRDLFAATGAHLADAGAAVPGAAALVALGTARLASAPAGSARALVPVYLRESDAAINWEQAARGPST